MKRLAIALLTMMICAPVWASDFNLPRGKWWESPQLVQRINLTGEQQESIRTQVVEHARRMIDLTAEVKRTELDLRELADRPSFDPQEVRSAYSRFQQARQVLDSERFELLLSIRQILTHEQWQELTAMRRERGERRSRETGQRPGIRGEQRMRPQGRTPHNR
jgi:Spy/CpxP family protein refolding chaperone